MDATTLRILRKEGVNDMSQKEIVLSPAEKKNIQKEIAINKEIERLKNTKLFNWNTKSIQVIKDKLVARKKLNLHNGNDWKVKFYEDKLKVKPKILSKLKRLI